VCLLFILAPERSGAWAGVSPLGESGAQESRDGTWAARSRTGLTLGGTWTAVADPKTGAVTGGWTLNDASGKPVRRGAWSPAKSQKGWSGAWRATVSGTTGEYSGTWSADVELKADARLADLFEAAVKAAVGGSWRAGAQSGAWSIRAASR